MSRSNPKNPLVIKFKHHGNVVYATEALAGKHREHCLCNMPGNECPSFKPGEKDHCTWASDLYAVCKKYGMTTPVIICSERPDDRESPTDPNDVELYDMCNFCQHYLECEADAELVHVLSAHNQEAVGLQLAAFVGECSLFEPNDDIDVWFNEDLTLPNPEGDGAE